MTLNAYAAATLRDAPLPASVVATKTLPCPLELWLIDIDLAHDRGEPLWWQPGSRPPKAIFVGSWNGKAEYHWISPMPPVRALQKGRMLAAVNARADVDLSPTAAWGAPACVAERKTVERLERATFSGRFARLRMTPSSAAAPEIEAVRAWRVADGRPPRVVAHADGLVEADAEAVGEVYVRYLADVAICAADYDIGDTPWLDIGRDEDDALFGGLARPRPESADKARDAALWRIRCGDTNTDMPQLTMIIDACDASGASTRLLARATAAFAAAHIVGPFALRAGDDSKRLSGEEPEVWNELSRATTVKTIRDEETGCELEVETVVELTLARPNAPPVRLALRGGA